MNIQWLLVFGCFVISCENRSAPHVVASPDSSETASQGSNNVNEDLKVLKRDLQVEATGREGVLDQKIGQ